MSENSDKQKNADQAEIERKFKRFTYVDISLVQPTWYADEIIKETDHFLHRAMLLSTPKEGQSLSWIEGDIQHNSSKLEELQITGPQEITFGNARKRKYKMRISADQGKLEEKDTPAESHGVLSWVRRQLDTLFKKK